MNKIPIFLNKGRIRQPSFHKSRSFSPLRAEAEEGRNHLGPPIGSLWVPPLRVELLLFSDLQLPLEAGDLAACSGLWVRPGWLAVPAPLLTSYGIWG